MNRLAIVDFISEFKSIKGGDSLPSERDMAKDMKSSRQVVRECILALEMSGCLVVSHGKSTQAKIDGDKWLAAFNKTVGAPLGVSVNSLTRSVLSDFDKQVELRNAFIAARFAAMHKGLDVKIDDNGNIIVFNPD